MKWIAIRLADKFKIREGHTAWVFMFILLFVWIYLMGEFIEFVLRPSISDVSVFTSVSIAFAVAVCVVLTMCLNALGAALRGWFE